MGHKDRESKLTQKDLKFIIGGLRTLTGNIDPSSGRLEPLAQTVGILQEELERGNYPDGRIKLPFFQRRRLVRIAADQELLQLKKEQEKERKAQIATRTYELKPGCQTTVDDYGWSAFLPPQKNPSSLFPYSETIWPLAYSISSQDIHTIPTLIISPSAKNSYASTMSLTYNGDSFEEGKLLLQIWKSLSSKKTPNASEEVQLWILPDDSNMNGRTTYLGFGGRLSDSIAYMKVQIFPTNQRPEQVTLTTLSTQPKIYEGIVWT